MDIDIIKALAVTAEVMGTELSEAGAEVMALDLSAWPLAAVQEALVRCRREVKGRLTLAAIIDRIHDGRPSPQEAWALCPKNERDTYVWSDEIREAFDVAGPLMREGDMIAARMAFIEKYGELLGAARSSQKPVKWSVSLGFAKSGRAGPILDAIRQGKLPASEARRYLPPGDPALGEIPDVVKNLTAGMSADKVLL